MQIKKFEARTMKEALEMVKTQLGPDAVILSAKEINKGFGLGGVKSIEITAAYSETVLKAKQYAESRMPQQTRDNFNRTSAKIQKETLQKIVDSRATQLKNKEINLRPVLPEMRTQRRYIDIDAEDRIAPPTVVPINTQAKTISAQMTPQNLTQVAQKTWDQIEVTHLKSEIEQLKNLLGQFKTVPQTFVQGHPGADYGVNYNLRNYFENLTKKGVLPDIAGEILAHVQQKLTLEQQTRKQAVEGYIAQIILNSVQISQSSNSQFHLFMGPSGSGKSTTMIKLASDLVMNKNKRVALISTDTVKIGADEQMKIFAQILNLPFISIRSQNDWQKVIPYLDQVDHVLVDFASFNLKNKEEIEYIQKMIPPVNASSISNHLVLSALSKDMDLQEIYKRYQALNITDIIFTSLDEANIHGNIFNFIRKTGCHLFGFGIGPKTPEDFEMATQERVLDLLLDITKTYQQQDAQI